MPLTLFSAQKMPFIGVPNSLGGTVPASLFALCLPYLGLIAHNLASLKLIDNQVGTSVVQFVASSNVGV